MKHLLLLTLLCFSAYFTFGQDLIYGERNSPVSLIYKIDDQKALTIIKSDFENFSSTWLNVVVDTVKYNDKNLKDNLYAPGHYIKVSSSFNKIEYEYFQIEDFKIDVNYVYEDPFLIVRDYNGDYIEKLNITYSGSKLHFDKEKFGYPVKPSKKTKILEVEYIGKTYFFNIRLKGKKYCLNKFEKADKKIKNTGYLALNKPRYRPGDTVKLKASLVRFNKPYRKQVSLTLSYRTLDRNFKTQKLTKLHPNEYGEVFYEFVLSDSIPLNRNINIEVKNSKGGYTIRTSNSFYAEDYQLNETFYTVQLEPEYHWGDTVKAFLKGFNSNGLPLRDIRFEAKLYPVTIQHLEVGYDFIPLKAKTYSGVLNDEGEYQLLLDVENYKANIGYELSIEFYNSEGEIRNVKKEFTSLNQEKSSLKLFFERDSVRWYSEANLPLKLNKFYPNGDKQIQEVLHFGKDKVYPLVNFYQLVNNIDTTSIYMSSVPSGISFKKSRTADSVKFVLKNINSLDIWFRLYKNKKVIQEGKSTTLQINQEADPNDDYNIVFEYTWAGSHETEKISLNPDKKHLNVEANFPDRIAPGDEIEVKLKIKDYTGKSPQRTSLTASAIDNKFPEHNLPVKANVNFPYTGPKERNVSITNVYKPNKKVGLTQFDVKKLGADSIAYYNFINSAEAVYLHYEELDDTLTQFAPFVYENNVQVGVVYVLLDGIPVFFNKADYFNTYSFLGKPGKHTITIRTPENCYTVKDLLLKKGSKLSIAIHPDKPEGKFNLKTEKRNKRLNEEEIKRLTDALVFIKNKSGHHIVIGYKQKFFEKEFSIYSKREKIILPLFPLDTVKLSSYGVDYTVVNNNMRFLTMQESNYMDSAPLSKSNFKRKIFKAKKGFLGSLDSYHAVKKTNKLKDIEYDSKLGLTPKNTGMLYLNKKSYHYSVSIYYQLVNNAGESFYYKEEELLNGLIPGVYDLTISKVYYNETTSLTISNIIVKPDTLTAIQIPELLFKEDKSIPFDSLENEVFIKTYREEIKYAPNIDPEEELKEIDKPNNSYSYFSYYKRTPFWEDISLPKISYFKLKISYNLAQVHGRGIDNNGLGSGLGIGIEHNLNQMFIRRNYYRPVSYNKKKWLKYFNLGLNFSTNNLPTDFGKNRIYQGEFYLKTVFKLPVSPNLTVYPYFSAGSGLLSQEKYKSANSLVIPTAFGMNFNIPGSHTFSLFAEYKYNFTSSVMLDGINTGSYDNYSVFSFGLTYSHAPAKHLYHHAEHFWGGPSTSEKKSKKIMVAAAGYVRDDNSSVLSDSIPSLPFVNKEQTEGIRKNFKEEGFWVPALYTDENGEATFKVQFPENITAWRTYVLASDTKGKQGIILDTIMSFKPLYAELKTPRFFVEEDSSVLLGKVSNYTDSSKTYQPIFSLNNRQTIGKENEVKTLNTHDFPVIIDQSDSVEFTFGIQNQQKVVDGEQHKLPVYPKGMYKTKGQFFVLKGDTSIQFKTNEKDGPTFIYAEGDLLNIMLDEVEKIQVYPYGCNEQIASKLSVLVTKKKIFNLVNKKFPAKDEKSIRQFINVLKENQSSKGAWSWWGKTLPNVQVTAYIAHVLNQAKKAGYECDFLSKTKTYLKNNYTAEKNNPLDVLSVLSELGIELEYASELNNLSAYQQHGLFNQLQVLKIKQQQGISYSLDEILNAKKETFTGGAYWGIENQLWYHSRVKTTLMAYDILRNAGNNEQLLDEVRLFLLSQRGKEWRNTFESAQILETILQDVPVPENDFVSELEIRGVLKKNVNEFPLRTTSDSSGVFHITKKGVGPIYLIAYQETFDKKPKERSKDFEVNTFFLQNNDTSSYLLSGNHAYLNVDIYARKEGRYVMVEVPIPAGCSYDESKKMGDLEVHREYFKNKVVVFYESMPAGEHQISIKLQPRYSGYYNLNPAKASLMYFPTFYGNNELKKIHIK